MRFLLNKIHMTEKEFDKLERDAYMWELVSDAFKYRVDSEDAEAKDKYGNVLLRFTKSLTYLLTIDADKIRKIFFSPNIPVKVTIVEDKM